ncbi:MAG TPA: hypothetical protein VN408_24385 [Actinoplanes sp.]|nr:hypothetical protein [Actinoplanes sp.]
MNVVWSATDPVTRRFEPTPVRSDPAALEERFRRLRRRRIRGYLDVTLAGAGSPRLTAGFRGEYAVVHLINGERSYVLAGDGRVPEGALVQVPIEDTLTVFDGVVVWGAEDAWDRIRDFLRTGRPDDLGTWIAV